MDRMSDDAQGTGGHRVDQEVGGQQHMEAAQRPVDATKGFNVLVWIAIGVFVVAVVTALFGIVLS